MFAAAFQIAIAALCWRYSGWEHTRYGADPRREDASSTWSPEQLARMDSDLCTRVEIAFSAPEGIA